MAPTSLRTGTRTLIVLLASIIEVRAVIVRGGGYRASQAYRTTTNGYYSSYDSIKAFTYGKSSTWRTTDAGAAAYAILSQLAVPNSPIRSKYVDVVDGDVCLNYENFNSTMLGEYQCPMDGFQPKDLYCCGPDGYKFCCSNSGRTNVMAIVIPIIVITVLLGIGLAFGGIKRKLIMTKVRAFCRRKQQPTPPPPPPGHKLEPMPSASNHDLTSHQNDNCAMPPPPPPPPAVYPPSGYTASAAEPPSYSQVTAHPSQFPNPSSQDDAASPPPPYGLYAANSLPPPQS